MTDSKPVSPGNPPDWGTYWQGAGGRAAVTHAGVASQVLGAFWRNFFSAAKRNIPQAKILDLASGNGAVVEACLAGVGGGTADPAVWTTARRGYTAWGCVTSGGGACAAAASSCDD